MYYLEGTSNIDKTMDRVLSPYYKVCHQEAYKLFLLDHSPIKDIPSQKEPLFGDIRLLGKFCPDYYSSVKDSFGQNDPVNESRLSTNYFKWCMDRLSERDPKMGSLVNIFLKLVIIHSMDDYTKGTREDTFGVVVLNGKAHFEEEDYVELLFHQMIHMITFMDGMLRPHMLEALKQRHLKTSIKNVVGSFETPYYVALHSLIVGVELLLYRRTHKTWDFNGNFHGTSDNLLKRCRLGSNFLLKTEDMLLDQGKFLLHSYRRILESF